MKTFELDDYCIQELNAKEMNETEGGSLATDIATYLTVYFIRQIAKSLNN